MLVKNLMSDESFTVHICCGSVFYLLHICCGSVFYLLHSLYVGVYGVFCTLGVYSDVHVRPAGVQSNIYVLIMHASMSGHSCL